MAASFEQKTMTMHNNILILAAVCSLTGCELLGLSSNSRSCEWLQMDHLSDDQARRAFQAKGGNKVTLLIGESAYVISAPAGTAQTVSTLTSATPMDNAEVVVLPIAAYTARCVPRIRSTKR